MTIGTAIAASLSTFLGASATAATAIEAGTQIALVGGTLGSMGASKNSAKHSQQASTQQQKDMQNASDRVSANAAANSSEEANVVLGKKRGDRAISKPSSKKDRGVSKLSQGSGLRV